MGHTVTALSYIIFVVAFVVIALIFTLSQLSWARWLRSNGTRIEAIVTHSEQAHMTRYYRHLFPRIRRARPERRVLRAQWTDPQTQKTYTFRRRNYRGPGYAAGDSIHVLVDPRNPRRYRIQ